MTSKPVEKRYSFISLAPGLDADTFVVHQFEGHEEISSPYEFKIVLVSKQAVDIQQVMANRATFIVHHDGGEDVIHHGVISKFGEIRQIRDHIQYKAILVPNLFNLTIFERSRVFLDVAVPDLMRTVLEDNSMFEGNDYELRLQNDYPQMQFVTQYRESNFNFLSRWMEREGIYFWFEQYDNQEKVIFSDTVISHTGIREQADIPYAPPSGQPGDQTRDGIQSFHCWHKRLPRQLFLKDYNYEKPSLIIEGRADVVDHGFGEKGIFGLKFETAEEGDHLAAIQADALRCQEIQYTAESSFPYLRAGFTFSLTDHYNQAYNRKYLITTITASGHQIGYLGLTLGLPLEVPADRPVYRNRITAIHAELQYRMEKKTTRPLISGIIHGRVDSSGSGQYADMDEHGRYLVHLPWDLDPSHGPGKASARVRMMQPYAGLEEGMHFPLRKGAEVSLVCTGGDPDRLEIAGAVPNTLCGSPVTSRNPSEAIISTPANNILRLDDKEGEESILMRTPRAESYLRMGAAKDPSPGGGSGGGQGGGESTDDPSEGIHLHTESDMLVEVGGDARRQVAGNNWRMVDGANWEFVGPVPDEFQTQVLAPSPEVKKGLNVAGTYQASADDNVVIKGQNGTLKITMEQDGIHIDAGGKDLFVDCRNEKRNVQGDAEDNWWGERKSSHHGNVAEFTFGATEKSFVGNQLKSTVGGVENFNFAETLDVTWSDNLKLAFGISKLAFDATILNTAVSLGIANKYTLWEVNKNEGYSKSSALLGIGKFGVGLVTAPLKKINDIISVSEEAVVDDATEVAEKLTLSEDPLDLL